MWVWDPGPISVGPGSYPLPRVQSQGSVFFMPGTLVPFQVHPLYWWSAPLPLLPDMGGTRYDEKSTDHTRRSPRAKVRCPSPYLSASMHPLTNFYCHQVLHGRSRPSHSWPVSSPRIPPTGSLLTHVCLQLSQYIYFSSTLQYLFVASPQTLYHTFLLAFFSWNLLEDSKSPAHVGYLHLFICWVERNFG